MGSWEREGMISLETAKNLKIAGLEWAYEYGFPKDCVYYKGKLHEVDGPGADNTFRLAPWGNYVKQDYIAFAPRLDQLLAEIEKRWSDYTLTHTKHDSPQYKIALESVTNWEGWHKLDGEFTADSPEEAAADALIWILTNGESKPFVPSKFDDSAY